MDELNDEFEVCFEVGIDVVFLEIAMEILENTRAANGMVSPTRRERSDIFE